MQTLSRLTGATALALVLGLGAPAHAQTLPALTVGVDVDAGTLDSRLARDTTAYRTADLIYSGLVQLTPELQPVPELAERWEAPDATTLVFTLREGLTFSDGSPLTADDVVFTFQTILTPDFAAPFRALYAPIAAVEAVDARTVKFTLSAPYAPVLSYLDIGIVPKALAEAGHDLALNPVGAGPMKLVEWNRGSTIVLEPNPAYWGPAPAVGRLTLQVIANNTARAQALEAGDLDIIQSPLSPQDIARLAADSRFRNVIRPGLGVTYLNFNTKDPLLAEPAMRRAFAMLVDQDTIVNEIYQGVDAVATGVILPSSWAYSTDIRQPTFDPEGAVALFSQLGWSDSNGDGILDRDGVKLSVTLATHTEDPNRVQTIEYLQAVMQEAGVDASVRLTDWPSFSTNYVQKGEHQIALLGWLNIVDPDRMLYGQLATGGPLNWGGYSSPEVDAALAEGRTALDIPARAAAYRRAAAVLAEEVPYFIVSYQGYQMFARADLPVKITATPRGHLRGAIMAAAD